MYETIDWSHVVFKNAEGIFYAVSPRVINAGYDPEEGTSVATEEERYNFYLSVIQQSVSSEEAQKKAIQRIKELQTSPLKGLIFPE